METFQLPPTEAQITHSIKATYKNRRLRRAGHHKARRVQKDITYSLPSPLASTITQDLDLVFKIPNKITMSYNVTVRIFPRSVIIKLKTYNYPVILGHAWTPRELLYNFSKVPCILAIYFQYC